METIIQAAKDYATLINSIVLIFLLFKYSSDIRKQALEYQKLELELRALRQRDEDISKRVVLATAEDVERYVIRPLTEKIARREHEFEQTQCRLISQLSHSEDHNKHLSHAIQQEERQLSDLRYRIQDILSAIELLDRHLTNIESREAERDEAQKAAARKQNQMKARIARYRPQKKSRKGD